MRQIVCLPQTFLRNGWPWEWRSLPQSGPAQAGPAFAQPRLAAALWSQEARGEGPVQGRSIHALYLDEPAASCHDLLPGVAGSSWSRAGGCRSHVFRSVAVNGVVGLRAEAASFHPNEGVAARSSVILVVPSADRAARGRTVPLVAAGSQSAPLIALSVSVLSRSNTPIFGCP